MFSSGQSANLFATIRANEFAGNHRKIVCMATRGQIVREWRLARGLKAADVAKLAGTSRQNIENFELDKVEFPRYLPKLAKAMGYARTDDLLALQRPPGQSPSQAPSSEPPHTRGVAAQFLSHVIPMIDPVTIAGLPEGSGVHLVDQQVAAGVELGAGV
jgi:transcriptional regulator with XRE-family HTH domain